MNAVRRSRCLAPPTPARALGAFAALACAFALAVSVVAGGHAAAAKPAHKPAATPAQAKQIAGLEALVDSLARELAALEARSATLTAKATTVPPTPPSVLPFQGPAGGSLTGEYPNPRLAPGSVGSRQIIPRTVDSAAVRNGSLTGADVVDGAIAPPLIDLREVALNNVAPFAGGSRVLGNAFEYPGPGSTVGQRTLAPGESELIKLSCPAGSHLLSGGWEWTDENGNGTTMLEAHPLEQEGDSVSTTWEWRPKVTPNIGTENTFRPKLLCLSD